jgi:hypothetical protein
MKQVIRPLGYLIALALIVAAFFVNREPPKVLLRLDAAHANASPADERLDFSAPGLDGRTIDLSHYRGHPVIVDFWATASRFPTWSRSTRSTTSRAAWW